MSYGLKPTTGRSLPEVLVVLLLTGIVAGLSLPAVKGLPNSLRLKQAAYLLEADLKRSSLMALQLGTTVQLVISSTGYQTHAAGLSLGNTIKRGLPPATTLSGPTSGEILFHPSGVVSPATLSLKSSDTECLIIISLRGRVSTSCE